MATEKKGAVSHICGTCKEAIMSNTNHKCKKNERKICLIHYDVTPEDIYTYTPCGIARELFKDTNMEEGYIYYRVWKNGSKIETEAYNSTGEEWDVEFERWRFK